MVALPGLLQHSEVGLHLGLVLERSAVDALELGIPFVALVVRAGDVREFESADPARMRNMRARA
jgi:hypothetical protein